MEGFMRKIYNFINGLEILHLIGECKVEKFQYHDLKFVWLIVKLFCQMLRPVANF